MISMKQISYNKRTCEQKYCLTSGEKEVSYYSTVTNIGIWHNQLRNKRDMCNTWK